MQVPALFLPIGAIKKISAKKTPKIVEKKIKKKNKSLHTSGSLFVCRPIPPQTPRSFLSSYNL